MSSFSNKYLGIPLRVRLMDCFWAFIKLGMCVVLLILCTKIFLPSGYTSVKIDGVAGYIRLTGDNVVPQIHPLTFKNFLKYSWVVVLVPMLIYFFFKMLVAFFKLFTGGESAPAANGATLS